MSKIRFVATPVEIGNWLILRLPQNASIQLRSRGMTLVEGTINGVSSKIVLESDGKGSHWFRVKPKLREAANINTAIAVHMEIEPSKAWPQPTIPKDSKKALQADAKTKVLWRDGPYSNGTLGLAPLDPFHQQSRNSESAHCGNLVKAQKWFKKAMLLQP